MQPMQQFPASFFLSPPVQSVPRGPTEGGKRGGGDRAEAAGPPRFRPISKDQLPAAARQQRHSQPAVVAPLPVRTCHLNIIWE